MVGLFLLPFKLTFYMLEGMVYIVIWAVRLIWRFVSWAVTWIAIGIIAVVSATFTVIKERIQNRKREAYDVEVTYQE